MKKHLNLKIIVLFSIIAAVLTAMPAISGAQDTSAGQKAPAAKKNKALPFHGKATTVDTNAMTLTVGTLNFNITSQTKITKDGKPATLSEITVGDALTGSYKKNDEGKLDASLVRDGKASAKTPKAVKKKKISTETNAPAAK